MMFGLANTAFGCHETLPSLFFPVDKKRHIFWMLFFTFGGIMLLYFIIASCALISFDGPLISDVYLLNFQVPFLITFFSKIFQKRYIELPILEVVIIGAPIKITYFFQVVLIKGGAPVFYFFLFRPRKCCNI